MAVEPIVMVAMPNCNELTLKWPRRVPFGEVADRRALTGGIEAFYRRLVGRGGLRCRQSQRLTERLLPPRSGSMLNSIFWGVFDWCARVAQPRSRS